jgi:choline-glycine betaine transporter
MKREAEQKKLEKWQSKSSGRQLVEIILGLILLGFGFFVLYLCVLGGWKQPHH